MRSHEECCSEQGADGDECSIRLVAGEDGQRTSPAVHHTGDQDRGVDDKCDEDRAPLDPLRSRRRSGQEDGGEHRQADEGRWCASTSEPGYKESRGNQEEEPQVDDKASRRFPNCRVAPGHDSDRFPMVRSVRFGVHLDREPFFDRRFLVLDCKTGCLLPFPPTTTRDQSVDPDREHTRRRKS